MKKTSLTKKQCHIIILVKVNRTLSPRAWQQCYTFINPYILLLHYRNKYVVMNSLTVVQYKEANSVIVAQVIMLTTFSNLSRAPMTFEPVLHTRFISLNYRHSLLGIWDVNKKLSMQLRYVFVYELYKINYNNIQKFILVNLVLVFSQ